jgi:hypothetical protein
MLEIINTEDRRSEEELEVRSKEELIFFNSLVDFPTDEAPIWKKGKRIEKLKDLSRRNLLLLVLKSLLIREHLIVSVAIPQAVTDRWPRILNSSQEHLRKNLACYRNDEIYYSKTVLHIRTNYNLRKLPNPSRGTLRRKTAPVEYYMSAIKKLSTKNLLEHETVPKSETIVIHTDLYESDLEKFAGDPNLDEFSSFFSRIKLSHEIRICYQSQIVPTFLEWCFAENFVMSISSLSYVAGLFNQNLVLYPEGHGHGKLKRWKILQEL